MANTNNSTVQSSNGIGIASVLGVTFLVLKLTHVINWSWLWVLAPFWIPWAIVLFILLIVGLVLLISEVR